MRKLLAAMAICLCLLLGAAAAETVTLTGTQTAVRYTATEDLTIILRDATLQDGLFVECAEGTTITLQLFGDNVINITTALDRSTMYTPDSAITVRTGNLSIVSGEENASLKVNQHFITGDSENIATIVPPAIRAERGSLTIAANNVTVQGGDLDFVTPLQDRNMEGDAQLQPRGGFPFVLGGVVMADKGVVISGDHVHILGGICKTRRDVWGAGYGSAVVAGASEPEAWLRLEETIIVSGDDVLCRGYVAGEGQYRGLDAAALAAKDIYMVGSPEASMTVRASEEDGEWSEVEGSPFTAKTRMNWELSEEDWSYHTIPFQVHTQITRTAPTATPAPAPAVPATGDSGHPALWLLMALTALISLTAWKARRA